MGFVVSGRLKGVGQCYILNSAVARLRYWAYPVGSVEM